MRDDAETTISPQELVNRLRELEGELPEALQTQLLAADGAIVPDLIAILEDALTDREAEHGWTPAHAAKLLGMLGDVQAVPVLLRLLEHYEAIDAYHQEAADALVMLGKPAIDACLEAYATTNHEDMRAGIASVLSRGATKDERSYQTLLDFFEQSPELGAIYLAQYGDARALGTLSRMFDALPVHDQDDSAMRNHVFVELKGAIEELGGQLTAAQQAKADRADAPRRRFAAQMQEALKHIAVQPHIEQALSIPSDSGGTAIRMQRKIGRNEPCWCGSGKKYKKCHLDLERA